MASLSRLEVVNIIHRRCKFPKVLSTDFRWVGGMKSRLSPQFIAECKRIIEIGLNHHRRRKNANFPLFWRKVYTCIVYTIIVRSHGLHGSLRSFIKIYVVPIRLILHVKHMDSRWKKKRDLYNLKRYWKIRQLNRLQSVMNSADQLVYSARRSEHVSPLLQELRWLCVPERIDFRLAVLVYRCINGTAPRYLASELQRVADIESRGRLRSSSTALFHVPRSLHKTIGDRVFPVPAPRVWNMLPPAITSLPSLQTF